MSKKSRKAVPTPMPPPPASRTPRTQNSAPPSRRVSQVLERERLPTPPRISHPGPSTTGDRTTLSPVNSPVPPPAVSPQASAVRANATLLELSAPPANAVGAATVAGPSSAEPSGDRPTMPTPVTVRASPSTTVTADLDDTFFSQREAKVAAHAAAHADDLGADTGHDHDPHFAHKMSPAVRARRQRFAQYVKVAVGVCGVVVLAAVVRVAIGGRTEPVHVASAMTQGIATGPEVRRTPTTGPDSPAGALALPPETAEAVAATSLLDEAPLKTAVQEKRDSHDALERGQVAKAIEAGERSVALDRTDGEAWLVLGAAYQEAGKAAEARRCYTSCTIEGKTGPIGECRAMLH